MKRSRTTRAALTLCRSNRRHARRSPRPRTPGCSPRSATDCGDPTLTQPFKPWLDSSHYKLVDGGDFENGTDGWALTGGAQGRRRQRDRRRSARRPTTKSLSLPAGSSATTPPVCVGLNEPTLRYFARKNSGLLSTMTVSVEVQPRSASGSRCRSASTSAVPGIRPADARRGQPAAAAAARPDRGALQVRADPRRGLADRRRLRRSARRACKSYRPGG